MGAVRAMVPGDGAVIEPVGDEIRGAVEHVVGAILMIAAAAIPAYLRRSFPWMIVAVAISALVLLVTLVNLLNWPPESSWSF